MRRASGIAAAALSLLPGAPFAQDVSGWGTELEMRPARPYIIVAPRYPREAAAEKRTAAVDVVGQITRDGVMKDPTFRSSSDDPAFQREVAEVVQQWLFKAPIDGATCEPKGGEAQLRVWFEIGEQGPKVSISAPPADARVAKAGYRSQDLPPIVHKEQVHFPRSAIQRGVRGARVLALARVNQKGEVEAVLFQNTGSGRAFTQEAERALSLWKYDVSGVQFDGRTHFCAEIPISFKLTD